MSLGLLALSTLSPAGCGSSTGVDPFERPDGAPAVAPTRLDFALLAEASRSDPGWTGATHGTGPPAGSITTVEVTECDPEMRRCSFRGPVRGDQPVISQRCLDDVKTTCTADADCGEGGRCRFMFPPFSSVNTPLCNLLYFESSDPDDPTPSIGVIDLTTGDVDYSVLGIRVAISLAGTCQDCLGDPQPRDGQPEGQCDGTEVACDVAGNSTTPPGSTSYECEPGAFSDLEVAIPASGASTTPTTWVLDDSRPRCTVSPFQGLECWCGMCDDGVTPCFADRQCGAAGSCGYPGEDEEEPTFAVAPDACDEPCDWDEEAQKGTCRNAAGQMVGCLPREGSISTRAGAEVKDGYYVSTLGLLTCMPATGNALLDGISGFPGPLFYQTAFQVTPRFEP